MSSPYPARVPSRSETMASAIRTMKRFTSMGPAKISSNNVRNEANLYNKLDRFKELRKKYSHADNPDVRQLLAYLQSDVDLLNKLNRSASTNRQFDYDLLYKINQEHRKEALDILHSKLDYMFSYNALYGNNESIFKYQALAVELGMFVPYLYSYINMLIKDKQSSRNRFLKTHKNVTKNTNSNSNRTASAESVNKLHYNFSNNESNNNNNNNVSVAKSPRRKFIPEIVRSDKRTRKHRR